MAHKNLLNNEKKNLYGNKKMLNFGLNVQTLKMGDFPEKPKLTSSQKNFFK